MSGRKAGWTCFSFSTQSKLSFRKVFYERGRLDDSNIRKVRKELLDKEVTIS